MYKRQILTLGHMQNSMRNSITLKLKLTLTLTITDTGGAVLTLKPHSHCAPYCAAWLCYICAVLRSTAPYGAVLRSTPQYCAVLRGVADKLLMLMYENYVK